MAVKQVAKAGAKGCCGVVTGFRDFLMRGNIIDLAVAVVIGNAFTALVNSFVQAFITPFIALVGGQKDYNALNFNIHTTVFPYGAFITALISFTVIAGVCYFIFVLPMKIVAGRMKKTAATTNKDCTFCCASIPLKATRCPQCTSHLEPEPASMVDKIGDDIEKNYVSYTD